MTVEDFTEKATAPCFYCGQKPSQTVLGESKRQYNGEFIHNGIDRKNNALGYTCENTVPCCKNCNRAKDTMTAEEFVAWATKVANHRR